jgi:hypothetical protein
LFWIYHNTAFCQTMPKATWDASEESEESECEWEAEGFVDRLFEQLGENASAGAASNSGCELQEDAGMGMGVRDNIGEIEVWVEDQSQAASDRIELTKSRHATAIVTARNREDERALTRKRYIRQHGVESDWSQYIQQQYEKNVAAANRAVRERDALEVQIADLESPGAMAANLERTKTKGRLAISLARVGASAESAIEFVTTASAEAFNFIAALNEIELLGEFYLELNEQINTPRRSSTEPFFGCVEEIPVRFRIYAPVACQEEWALIYSQTPGAQAAVQMIARQEMTEAKKEVAGIGTALSQLADLLGEVEFTGTHMHEDLQKVRAAEADALAEVAKIETDLRQMQSSTPKGNSQQRRNFRKKITLLQEKLLPQARARVADLRAQIRALEQLSDSSHEIDEIKAQITLLQGQADRAAAVSEEKTEAYHRIRSDLTCDAAERDGAPTKAEIEKARRQRHYARKWNKQFSADIRSGRREAKPMPDPTGYYVRQRQRVKNERDSYREHAASSDRVNEFENLFALRE